MEHPETLNDWRAYLVMALTAAFALIQAFIPFMKEPSRDAQRIVTNQKDRTRPRNMNIGSYTAF